MGDITAPRVEGIADSGQSSPDEPPRKSRAKADVPRKPAPAVDAELGAADEEEKRILDEMA